MSNPSSPDPRPADLFDQAQWDSLDPATRTHYLIYSDASRQDLDLLEQFIDLDHADQGNRARTLLCNLVSRANPSLDPADHDAMRLAVSALLPEPPAIKGGAAAKAMLVPTRQAMDIDAAMHRDWACRAWDYLESAAGRAHQRQIKDAIAQDDSIAAARILRDAVDLANPAPVQRRPMHLVLASMQILTMAPSVPGAQSVLCMLQPDPPRKDIPRAQRAAQEHASTAFSRQFQSRQDPSTPGSTPTPGSIH